MLKACCKDGFDMPACFPQGPRGFIGGGFAPPTGNESALDPQWRWMWHRSGARLFRAAGTDLQR